MSSISYVANRQTMQLAEMGDGEINIRLGALAEHFGDSWLTRADNHPLQSLWARRDALATNQLVLIGDAVLFGAAMDAKWLARQIRDIKGPEANNRRGAMFELLGANMMKGPTVTPTPSGFPGYDLVAKFHDKSQMLVSLKSYGESTHEAAFKREAQKIDVAFVAQLTSIGVTGLCLRAMIQSYPSGQDWTTLLDALPAMLTDRNVRLNHAFLVGRWAIVFADSPKEVKPISNNYMSYQVLILAPFHQNESKNLIDKLEDAAANARRHAKPNECDTARAVLVRLPETISMHTCAGWAKDYMAGHSSGPLDSIMLYQPAVADTASGDTTIDHGFACCFGGSYANWQKPDRAIAVTFLVGTTSAGSKLTMPGAPDTMNLDTMYVYQRGQFYTVFQQQSQNAPLEGRTDNLASGITRHAVMKLQQGDEMVLSGIFPPEKTISIFD